jgi:hypothetical protein
MRDMDIELVYQVSMSDISWSFPYPTLMLRIQRGLRNPWLLASQDEVTLTPPRALFTLDLMPHGRVRHSLLFAALPSGCPTGHSQTMLVLMVTGILDGDYTNSSNLTLLATRRQPHSLFERWSNLFGGWTPHHRASHPDAHPKRIEHGASRLEAKVVEAEPLSRFYGCIQDDSFNRGKS